MPPSSKRKPKKAKKKFRTLTNNTTTNNHSSPNVLQLKQGNCGDHNHKLLKEQQRSLATFNHNSRMEEGSFNGALEEEEEEVKTQKVESLSEDNKRVVVEVSEYDGDSAIITDEHKEHVSNESVLDDPFEPDVNSTNEFNDTVELELKEDEEKALLSHHEEPEGTNGLSQVEAENEASREFETVETFIKGVMASEEDETNVLSSTVVTDFISNETLETDIPKSDENEKVPPTTITDETPKGSEKSSVPSKDEEIFYVQETSYESSKGSFQPIVNVPDAERTGVTVQNETEVARSSENQNIVYMTQRQYTSWRSCCGIFEILKRGDR